MIVLFKIRELNARQEIAGDEHQPWLLSDDIFLTKSEVKIRQTRK
jgi:hypothetical protein